MADGFFVIIQPVYKKYLYTLGLYMRTEKMDIQIDENTSKEEINKMVEEFEKLTGEELEKKNSDRRNRQSGQIDNSEVIGEEVEFRFKYPPNCS